MHDIILMKHATDRVKDAEDIEEIINKEKINWNTILEETKNQLKLGKQRAAFDLGLFLESLESTGINIPKNVSDELFKIFENQIKEKRKKLNNNKF